MTRKPTLCSVDGCVKRVKTKRMCSMHHARVEKHGDPLYKRAPYAKTDGKPPCSINGCESPMYCRELCAAHYHRLRLHGDPLGSKPKNAPTCTVNKCEDPHYCKGMCVSHYQQQRRHGDTETKKRKGPKPGRIKTFVEPVPGGPSTRQWGHSTTKSGYVTVYPPGRRSLLEHRYVMELHIGRSLVKGETIHHKNGDRQDNRIENLELWSTSQPKGQRVVDKIEWAEQILNDYGGLRQLGLLD